MKLNDIIYRINGAIFEVNRVLRSGFLEILNYLKATGMRVGLLVNFRAPKAEIRRLVLNLSEDDKPATYSDGRRGVS